LALGEVTWDNARRVIIKEALVALANGFITGIVAAVIVWLWYGPSAKMGLIGGIIALAMLNNMLIAGVAGTAVPLILKRLKADPALASTVFVTTCTDVGGFLSFLGIATLLIKYLV
jgi:magnesium transporter